MKAICIFWWTMLSIFFASNLFAQTPPGHKDSVFTEYFRRTSDWVASDGTISVPLPSGKTLWLMGDSHIGGFNAADTTIPCLFQVRNCILQQNILVPTEFSTILDNSQTGINRTPIKASPPDATYFWPAHGYAKRDTAVIFWQQYTGADYTHLATYVSKIYTPNLTDASAIKKLVKLDIPAAAEFGTAVVVDSAAKYIYLYGQVKDYIIFRPRVARIGINKEITGKWEFFNGSTWTSDETASAQLMGSTSDYVSPSYSVVKLQEKYYLFSQDVGYLTCGLGRGIYSWQSDRPEGPFVDKKLLYTIEDKYRNEYMITYNATVHPEFIKNNEILISYNVNGACTSYCGSPFTDRFNADLYRPKFARVPLDYINPDLNVPDPVYPIETITGVSSAEPVPSLYFNVYPNPGNGKIIVETPGLSPAIAATVSIRDAIGQEILKAVPLNNAFNYTLPVAGVYFVSVSVGRARKTVRVIVR